MNFSRDKINQAKEIVENGLKSNGLSYLPSETNFILVNLGNIDADKFRDEMLKKIYSSEANMVITIIGLESVWEIYLMFKDM